MRHTGRTAAEHADRPNHARARKRDARKPRYCVDAKRPAERCRPWMADLCPKIENDRTRKRKSASALVRDAAHNPEIRSTGHQPHLRTRPPWRPQTTTPRRCLRMDSRPLRGQWNRWRARRAICSTPQTQARQSLGAAWTAARARAGLVPGRRACGAAAASQEGRKIARQKRAPAARKRPIRHSRKRASQN